MFDIEKLIETATAEAKELIEARNARRAAIREQILADQATNAKRDKKALRAEEKWYRENGGRK